jgi:hypothetical protein
MPNLLDTKPVPSMATARMVAREAWLGETPASAPADFAEDEAAQGMPQMKRVEPPRVGHVTLDP